MAQGDRPFAEERHEPPEAERAEDAPGKGAKGRERRQSTRWRKTIPFSIRLRGDATFRQPKLDTIDVSERGFLFEYHEAFFVGTRFDVLMELSGEGVVFSARAVRVIEIERHRRYFVGAEFLDLSPEDRERLQGFVHRYRLDPFLRPLLGDRDGALFLQAGVPPIVRRGGELLPQGERALTPAEIERYLDEYVSPHDRRSLREGGTWPRRVELEGGGTFRLHLCLVGGEIAATFTPLSPIPTLSELGLPETVRELLAPGGGILFVSAATRGERHDILDRLVQTMSEEASRVIYVIGMPGDRIIPSRKSLVRQIEIPTDAPCVAAALQGLLPAPLEVVAVRYPEDCREELLSLAEGDTLVIAAWGIGSATDAIERFVRGFPPPRQEAAAFRLAARLRGVVSPPTAARSTDPPSISSGILR
ncbi:MAG: hypothetical protein D6795_04650, partial [Deltaproteobacteria bacterium]